MVYAMAELIRRQRGGAAVVLGALSPRTRNAQVALYQSGDVDYIVATDAIGMGLNMDVDHVAFASTRKFDGFQYRQLNPAELGQVAGRAGRYMNDGTFGVTGEAEPFDAGDGRPPREPQFRFRAHAAMAQPRARFRARSSACSRSLNQLPQQRGPDAGPARRRYAGARSRGARSATSRPGQDRRSDVERLWEVCQIPDYRNISHAEHAHLVGRIFQFLQTGDGFIAEDWFVAATSPIATTREGDLDTLSNRISPCPDLDLRRQPRRLAESAPLLATPRAER